MTKPRRGHDSLRRTAGNRPGRKAVTMIMYDGERTEDDYFRNWKMRLGSDLILEPLYVRSGGNSLTLVKRSLAMIKGSKGYESIYCVTDVDDTSPTDLKQAMELAKKSGISLVLSSRCFEVWIGLHFVQSAKFLTNEREALALVSEHIPTFTAQNKVAPFNELLPRTRTAIKNAKWLGNQNLANPRTDVHVLVEKLIDVLDPVPDE